MIPTINIKEWRENVSWANMEMVEHDLVICKALVCLFNNPIVKEHLVFRGGTALNKLFIKPASRYSEDIDFVQKKSEPVGKIIDAIRGSLKSWLGEPHRRITKFGVKLTYRYTAENGRPMKLKIEINSTEHFNVLDLCDMDFSVQSKWFEGDCLVAVYQLEELIATKLRALFQRRKGRDLFDIWYVFEKKLVDPDKVIEIFQEYCDRGGTPISRGTFFDNMEQKRDNIFFQTDMLALLPEGISWNFDQAFEFVQHTIISKIPG